MNGLSGFGMLAHLIEIAAGPEETNESILAAARMVFPPIESDCVLVVRALRKLRDSRPCRDVPPQGAP